MIVKFTGIGRLFILRLQMRSQILKALLLVMPLSYMAARAQDPNQVQAINRDANGVDASAHAGVDEETLRVPQPSQAPVKPATTYSRWGITASAQPPATQYWPGRASSATSTDTSTDGKSAVPRNKPPLQAGSKPLPSAVASVHAGINTPTRTQSESNGTSFSSTSPSFQGAGKRIPSTAWSFPAGGVSLESANTENFGSAEPQANSLNGLDSDTAQNGHEGPQHPKALTAPVSPQSDGFSSPFSGQRQMDGFSSPFSASHFDFQPLPQANSSRKRNPGRAREHEHSSQKTPDSAHAGAVARFPNKKEKSAASGAAAKID